MAAIASVRASAYTIPTDSPESDGTLSWDSTTLVVVEVEADGHRGLGYSYTDEAAVQVVKGKLATAVVGRDAMDTQGCWWAMEGAVRNIGRPGMVSMAISATDIALWDLKARLLGVPIVALTGAVRDAVPLYASGGFTSYSVGQLKRQLGSWARGGFGMVKMKVGREPDQDPGRVRQAREAIGDDVALFVDGNGAYSPQQALAMAHAFAEQGVCWFEEPVSSDDPKNLRFIREHSCPGLEVAAGEYAYGPRDFEILLEARAVDVLQADATRCGGFTGFLQAGALCAARGMPLSCHCAPSLHAHLGCMVQAVRHLEYFHDHVRIEEMLFEGAPRAKDGLLRPDPDRPGLGLEFRRQEAQRFASGGAAR